MNTGFPGDGMGQMVVLFIAIVAVIVVGGILFAGIKGLGEWSNNNAQPVQRVPAKIVARRTNLSVNSHHHHGAHRETPGGTSLPNFPAGF